MAWIQPKTNWQGGSVNGVYTGDYFNLADYNRIKNNLQELRNMAIKLYPEFSVVTGADWKDYNIIPLPKHFNQLEENLEKIRKNTYPFKTGAKKTYYGNVAAIDFAELNRLESATLLIYENLKGQSAGKRRLSFELGGFRF
jgi:hypothetical protein